MKLRAIPILLALAAIIAIWGVGSWVISQASKKHFDAAVETLATGHAKDFFELEVLSYKNTLFGSTAEVALIPTFALMEESVGNQKFSLNRINGPLFINSQGVQLGFARWELIALDSASEIESDVDLSVETSSPSPIGSVVVGFSENADIRFDAAKLALFGITFDTLKIDGHINTESFDHEISVQAATLTYKSQQLALNFPFISLVSKRLKQAKPDNSLGNVIKLLIEADEGELFVKGRSKKIPFNLQSHGSIWVNNDTLSVDWQSRIDSGQLLKVKEIGNTQRSEYLKIELSLQFRELLASGFWHHLNKQSEIYSLFQQAEWAMEEVETTEQQDFLRSLFLDADRIKRSQQTNPLKPLLIANRSKLAANVKVSDGRDGILSQLSLSGNAISKAKKPELSLRGEVKVVREMLDKRWSAMINKWSNRRWFRRYETEFESDITVRNERLLLNDMIVSVDSLSAELSQALTDQ